MVRPAIAGRTMARSRHYKRVAVIGTSSAMLLGCALAVTTLPLWGLLTLLSLFAVGLGTAFPVSTVAMQNAVARSQIGTVTGAANFFRALMASFMVAAFSAILLMALGADGRAAAGRPGHAGVNGGVGRPCLSCRRRCGADYPCAAI